MAKRDPHDYDALSRAFEAGEYTARGPIEYGPGLREGRPTAADYEALADSYEEEPPRAAEVIGPIEVNPAHANPELRALLNTEAEAAENASDEDDGAPLPPHTKVSRPNRPTTKDT